MGHLPLDQFLHFEQTQPKKVYLKQPIKGEWRDLTWEEVGREARTLAAALKKLNLPPHSPIAMISKNCAHWIITDIAIWMAGHVSVPLYPTLTAESIAYILEHSEAKLVFIGKLDDWKSQKSGVPDNLIKVQFPFWNNEGCTKWDDFIDGSSPLKEIPTPQPDDLFTIIYTSGTTGNPKGVVHTCRSAATHIKEAKDILHLNSSDRFFSYLPLSHVAERLLVELGSIYSGGVVYFAESLDSFKENLVYAQPTIFLAVPRIWLKFQQGILAKIPQKKLKLLISVPVIGRMIKKKLKKALGLNQVRYAVCGAAPISKELLEWFDSIGIPILEAYGMTENFALTSLNLPWAKRYGTVGKPFAQTTDFRLSEDGEILSKSDANMVGYFKEEAKTKEMLDQDGWLHSGDKGELDPGGFLKVTGRVKDAFKTTKGKYVTPTKIEALFEMCELIEQVCVMGAGLSAPIAVVVLNDMAKKLEKDHIQSQLKSTLDRVNGLIENYETLSHVIVVKDIWTIENGLLTPTLKLKRNLVEKKYSTEMEKWTELSGKIHILL